MWVVCPSFEPSGELCEGLVQAVQRGFEVADDPVQLAAVAATDFVRAAAVFIELALAI